MNRFVSKFRILTFACALASLIAVASGLAYGQAISGDLTGTVVDPTGATVSGATVTAVNMATGRSVTTTTKSAGEYRFGELPVGNYNLSVSAPSFKTTTVEGVPVELNKVGTTNVKLEIGSSSTTVEVSGVAPPVDTSTAQLQSNYTDQFSQDIGLTSAGGLGAGVLNLSLLSAGVAQASSMGDGVGPSVGGQRPRANNFTVEGVDNNNKSVTGALITVPNDAVDSFTLLENQFNSEFGHSSGGQFNTTIKTGTNSFHGSAYEYFRNRNLDAVDNTYALQGLTKNPRFDSNRYGGTIGGPIVRNKLFFFVNFERQPVGLTGTGGGQVDTPTAAGLGAIGADPGINATNFGVFKKYVPAATAPDPKTPCIQYNGLTTGGSHFGNPPVTFSAPANGVCPAGNVEVGVVTIAAPAFQNYENFVQSADYNISAKDQLRERYVYNKLDEIDTAAALSTFYAGQPFRFHLATLSEYHTFSPGVLNELRLGFNRYANTLGSGNVKFPGLDAFPNLTFQQLGSGLNVGPDPNSPSITIQNYYGVTDNVSWTKGKHELKFGVEWHEYISPQQFTQRKRGDYIYNTAQLFMEDFSPDNFGERSTGSVTYYGNQSAIYWYANDTWRIKPHLSLNLGIRYEFTTLPESEAQQTLNAISNDPSIIVAALNEPLVFNKPQVPKNNWAPRIGIAYSPGDSGTTSIRAGFGMAYDVLYDNIGTLAVPPQIGATADVIPTTQTAGFLAGGGLPGGGSGTTVYDQPTARGLTSNWIPQKVEWPYSINWNLGIQHSFGKEYSAEVRYVGTRGIHLDVQDRINKQAIVNSQNFLPTYIVAPTQAQLDALPLTLCHNPDPVTGACAGGLESGSEVLPEFAAAGFTSNITADLPLGWSSYHGLQSQVTRRFSNGLTFQAAYTWSHTIDNSTADFHSTDLTPRRPQDFLNWRVEKATSALSRTHRFTLAMLYQLPYFKSGNWARKNILGNWQFTPVYTYESPEFATVQSTQDSNLNGDPAGDRAILNPTGIAGTGGGVQALTNTAGDVVAYQALDTAGNPCTSAQQCPRYILAGIGALADIGRNTLATRPTNNFDLAVYKDVGITERVRFRFGAQFANVLNHAQYIPGIYPGQGLGVNDVNSFSTVGSNYQSYLTPGNVNFNIPKSVFASGARTLALVAKLTF